MNFEKHRTRSTAAALVLVSIFGVGVVRHAVADPAQASSTNTPAAIPAPTYLLYHLLFRHLTGLRSSANNDLAFNAVDQSTFYKHALGLEDGEFQKLLSIAKGCENTIAQDDAQARQIISEARSRFPGGKLAEGQALPEVPDSLKALQNHRNATINHAIGLLHNQLTPAAANRIDGYISTYLAPRSNAQKLTIPHNRNRANAAAKQ